MGLSQGLAGNGGVVVSGGAVSFPLTSGGHIAMQPSGISNNAIDGTNAAGAVSGLQVSGQPGNAGALLNAGPQLNVISSDAASSLVINPKGAAYVQVAQAPQTGGVVVATSTDNNANRYGSGMFNGCMQIFRPSNTATRDNAMPWLLMGDENANEFWTQGVQTYTPPVTSSFTSFLNSVASDAWLRGFGIAAGQQTIRIGVSKGAQGAGQANLNGSILDIAPGINGNAGTLINGITVTGAVAGSAPAIGVHTIPTITGQTGDTNVGLNLTTLGTGIVTVLSGQAVVASATNPVVGAGNVALTNQGAVGLATAAGFAFSDTLVNDVVLYNNPGTTRIRLGSFGTGASTLQINPGGSTQVNSVRVFGSPTTPATPPGMSVVGTDAAIDLSLFPKGTGVIFFGYASVVQSGVTAATLGNTGGGPTTAAQYGWRKTKNSDGTAEYVPVWR